MIMQYTAWSQEGNWMRNTFTLKLTFLSFHEVILFSEKFSYELRGSLLISFSFLKKRAAANKP